jgi:hypothetical protein
MIFCTVTCTNHLAKTKILAETIQDHMPNSKLIVCLNEETISENMLELNTVEETILAKDLWLSDFTQFTNRYNQKEAACACKAPLLKYIYKKYKQEETIIYIDSDIQVFGQFTEVFLALNHSSIVLTPHFIKSTQAWKQFLGYLPETDTLNAGIFNGGFIALKRSTDAENFLNWWTERLKYYAFDKVAQGLFYDQKWLDLVPIYFENVYILKHEGYNVAYWNLFERNLKKINGNYYVNKKPLRFFHFSNFSWFDRYLYLFNINNNNHYHILKSQYTNQLEHYASKT